MFQPVLRRFASAQTFGTLSQAEGNEELVSRLAALTAHPGYDRSQVVSAVLKKLLPPLSLGQPCSREALQARVRQAALDTRSLDYLLANVRTELCLAHERSTA